MWKSRNKCLGVTLGDPLGIGPEIVAKAMQIPSIRALAKFKLIGDSRVFRFYYPSDFKNFDFIDLKNFHGDLRQHIPTAQSGRASREYIDCAISLLKQNEIHGLITAPVSKE